ncbi:hypothetical protein IAR55_006252 [Kwoniella newhampshirensis]|uniref:Zn(2)-C6 fungal-type domain-containing protein n=1 Tax=Kwoniella newhampshirensis TaxID=1651941 RepID=A0AAW0YFH5_9TREE
MNVDSSDLPQPAARGSADPARSPSAPAPQARSACEPCRKRKIKCTGERPKCTRCERLGKECVYESVVNTWTYIAALEKRLQTLEQRERVFQARPVSQATRSRSPPHRLSGRHALEPDSVRYMWSSGSTSPRPAPPESEVAAREWSQISFSSDAQLVADLPIDNDLIGELSRPRRSTGPTALSVVDHSLIPPAHIVSSLVDHFRTCTGASYPIFHIPSLLSQIDAVSSSGGALLPRSDVCVVILVLAVASTSLPLKSPLYNDYRPRASALWIYAQDIIPKSYTIPGLTRLQILLIKLQYVLYNPPAGNVWDLAGSAVRLAVDLGLHLEHAGPSLPSVTPLEQDMRRRLFWISYNLERNVCTALSRPPSIPDGWISASFPSLMDDTLITADAILSGDPSPLKVVAVHRFRLRLLQSEILDRLYRPGPSSLPSRDWYDSVVERLNQWRGTLPSNADSWSDEWSDTKYHLTLIMLFRPSPARPAPDRESLARTIASAGRVMRAHKELNRSGGITFNWFTTYQLFLVSAAYLNALWQASRKGWQIVQSVVESMLDIQSCTSVMEAISAIAPGTTHIRDATDAISERIIRYLTSRTMPHTSTAAGTGTRTDLRDLEDSNNGAQLSTSVQDCTSQPSASGWSQQVAFSSDDWLLPAMDDQDSDALLRLLGDIQPENWERCIESEVHQTLRHGFQM